MRTHRRHGSSRRRKASGNAILQKTKFRHPPEFLFFRRVTIFHDRMLFSRRRGGLCSRPPLTTGPHRRDNGGAQRLRSAFFDILNRESGIRGRWGSGTGILPVQFVLIPTAPGARVFDPQQLRQANRPSYTIRPAPLVTRHKSLITLKSAQGRILILILHSSFFIFPFRPI